MNKRKVFLLVCNKYEYEFDYTCENGTDDLILLEKNLYTIKNQIEDQEPTETSISMALYERDSIDLLKEGLGKDCQISKEITGKTDTDTTYRIGISGYWFTVRETLAKVVVKNKLEYVEVGGELINVYVQKSAQSSFGE